MHGKTAQRIAESVSTVIGYGVLVTDEKGVIIGCSDEGRIGSLHEPSLEVLRTGTPALTFREDTKGMKGVRTGYTAPILFSGHMMGTIAIAGPTKRAERYGLLVRKQAEILLMEQAFLEVRLRRQQALRDLAEEVLLYSPDSGEGSTLLLRGRELGIHLDRPRVAVVLEPFSPGEEVQQKVLDMTRAFLPAPGHMIVALQNFRVLLFLALHGGRSPREEEDAVEALCGSLSERLHGEGVPVHMGIGILSEGLDGLADSGRTARQALAVGRTLGGSIHPARSLGVEMLLSAVPRPARKGCVNALPAGWAEDPELERTFLAWCESPFAPGTVAKRLSIHRNTLQYRLKRIREVSGLDPRNLRDCFMLWSACILRAMERGERAEAL